MELYFEASGRIDIFCIEGRNIVNCKYRICWDGGCKIVLKPPPGVRKSNKNAARNEPAFLLDFRTKGGGFPNQTKDFLTGEVKK